VTNAGHEYGMTDHLIRYMVSAHQAELPLEVVDEAKYHILDTIAAMVSGTQLPPGRKALEYADLYGMGEHASIASRQRLATPQVAALVNGMLAHADETDDSHANASMHPGCSIVPAALAMSEKNDLDGDSLIRAVVLGYDAGVRMMKALGPSLGSRGSQLSAGYRYDRHALGGTFGSAVAAGACASSAFDETQWNYLLSYAAHQASGMPSYPLDSGHVEKSFIFGGMPSRNGVTAATMVEAGFTGIVNDIEGEGGFIHCFGTAEADVTELSSELGERYEILNTNIKKYSVGSPCQAPVDSLVNIIDRHRVLVDDCERMTLYAVAGETPITRRDQEMPSLNVRYLLAATLLDGRLGFAAAHDRARMSSPEVQELMDRIDIQADPNLITPESRRQAIVEFQTRDGQLFREHVVTVRGTVKNRMSKREVDEKARDLLELALPAQTASSLIDRVHDLQSPGSVAYLTQMLRASV